MNACARHAQFCSLARSGTPTLSGSGSKSIEMDWSEQHFGAVDGRFAYKNTQDRTIRTDIKPFAHSAGRRMCKLLLPPRSNQASNAPSMGSKDYLGIPLLVPNHARRTSGPR